MSLWIVFRVIRAWSGGSACETSLSSTVRSTESLFSLRLTLPLISFNEVLVLNFDERYMVVVAAAANFYDVEVIDVFVDTQRRYQ